MFFVPISRMTNYSREQQVKIDSLLVQAVRHDSRFTPHTFERELQMSLDDSWELLFDLVQIGALCRIEVSICTTCGKKYEKQKSCMCESDVRKGFYWKIKG